MNIKTALCPFNPSPGEPEKNAENMAVFIAEAKKAGAELIIFPEMSIPGYCLGDLHKNPDFIRRQYEALNTHILPASSGISTVLGMTVTENNKTMPDGSPARYNGYVFITDGKIIKFGKKTLLVDEGVLEDSRYFLLGNPDEISPVQLKLSDGTKISAGIMVCQDMWDDFSDVHPAQILANKGADILISINSSPFYAGKSTIRRRKALNRISETGLPLVYVNASGIQDIGKNIVIFDGDSFAVTNGQIKQNQCFEDKILTLELNTSPIKDFTPVLQPPDTVEVTANALIYTLRQFFERSKVFKGAVLGLSGGIDSALDALLLAKALGAEKLLTVNMPGRYNGPETKSIASEIARNIGCEYLVHPIQDIIDVQVKILSETLGKSPETLTVENMQARARGNILMEYSQEYGYMVVGNGNKTEFQRGYATLYGDILGAIMPLGDIHKLMVYEISNYLDPNREIIPGRLYTLRPSAELSPKHNISEGGGDPFDYFIEAPMGVEIVENGRNPEELQKLFSEKKLDETLWKPDLNGLYVYDKLDETAFFNYAKEVLGAIRNSYFKRVQAPPIPVVTKRAFGLDYRESLFPPYR